MHIGLLLLDAGKPEAAAEALGKAVALRREPLALLRLSRALERAGRTAEAAATLQEAGARDANPETFLELATLLAKLDNGAEALNALDKALAGPLPPDRRARILGMTEYRGIPKGETLWPPEAFPPVRRCASNTANTKKGRPSGAAFVDGWRRRQAPGSFPNG